MKNPLDIKELSDIALNNAYNEVINNEVYGVELKLCEQILKQYPNNTDINTVALKISLVDVTHSTHFFMHKQKVNLKKMAEKIVELDFDERVKKGDLKLVNELADCGQVNLISFASKYCQLHNFLVYGKDDYLKVDSMGKACIKKYAEQKGMIIPRGFNKMFENNYTQVMEIVDKILADVDVDKKHVKFDYLMWYYNR